MPTGRHRRQDPWMCVHVWGATVMYMVTGIGSSEPTRRRTSFSRHVWFPPSEARDLQSSATMLCMRAMHACVHACRQGAGVCENTPPENETLWKISFQSTKSGAGEQFLPLDGIARARIRGCFFRIPARSSRFSV